MRGSVKAWMRNQAKPKWWRVRRWAAVFGAGWHGPTLVCWWPRSLNLFRLASPSPTAWRWEPIRLQVAWPMSGPGRSIWFLTRLTYCWSGCWSHFCSDAKPATRWSDPGDPDCNARNARLRKRTVLSTYRLAEKATITTCDDSFPR